MIASSLSAVNQGQGPSPVLRFFALDDAGFEGTVRISRRLFVGMIQESVDFSLLTDLPA
jgi:hypothetical protein